MFENQNHLYALATVIGTMGGFQQQPEWFKSISTTSILCLRLTSSLAMLPPPKPNNRVLLPAFFNEA